LAEPVDAGETTRLTGTVCGLLAAPVAVIAIDPV
jgi:hypothetical protein